MVIFGRNVAGKVNRETTYGVALRAGQTARDEGVFLSQIPRQHWLAPTAQGEGSLAACGTVAHRRSGIAMADRSISINRRRHRAATGKRLLSAAIARRCRPDRVFGPALP